MPFFRHSVPDGWLVFNGNSFTTDVYPELWASLYYASDEVRKIWHDNFGGVIDDFYIGLPDISDPHMIWELVYAFKVDKAKVPDMVLAIKAERTEIDDDAKERPSQVHDSDSDEG